MSVEANQPQRRPDAGRSHLRPIDGAGGGNLPPGSGGPERPGYGPYQVALPEAIANHTVFDLRTLISILRRRLWLLVGLALLATVGSLLYVGQLTSLYLAQSQIVVAPDRTSVIKGGEVVDPLPGDMLTLSTEAAKITSSSVAARAVDLLNLEQDPRFNPTLGPVVAPDQGSGIARMTHGVLETLGLVDPPAPAAPPPQMDPEMVRQTVIGRFLAGAAATPAERSRIIVISYTYTDATFAAQAANAIAVAYIEGQSQTYDDATQEALNQVQAKIDEIQPQLKDAQRRLEEFRQAHGLANVNETSQEQRSREQLNSDLLDARADLSDLQNRLQQVEAALNGQGSIDTAPDVISNSLVQSLRLEEIQLTTEVAQLASKYRDGHPKMIEAKARLEEVRARLRSEISKIKGILQNEVSRAASRVAQLESALAEVNASLEVQGDAQVELSTLAAEVDAMQKQYDALLDRYNQIASQAGINDRPGVHKPSISARRAILSANNSHHRHGCWRRNHSGHCHRLRLGDARLRLPQPGAGGESDGLADLGHDAHHRIEGKKPAASSGDRTPRHHFRRSSANGAHKFNVVDARAATACCRGDVIDAQRRQDNDGALHRQSDGANRTPLHRG